MRKVLVTGVGGFIGSRVAARFISDGFSVVGIDDLSSGHVENIPAGVDFILGDLSIPDTIKKIPSNCRIILHLAGQSSGEISFDDPVADLAKNTISTLNLIRFGIDNHIDRFVYASSMSTYGAVEDKPVSEETECKPLSCYGVGKLAAEGYLRVYKNKLPFVALRMFNVYGPGQDMNNLRQGMVSIYLAQALKHGNIEVKGSLTRFRDFIYIDDVVEAWYRASNKSSAIGECINIGTGRKTTVDNLLQKICNLVPNSKYYVNGETPGDQSGIYADINNLQRCLGMNAFVPLDEGLRLFLNGLPVAR